MFKNIIRPVQAWLISQGRCAGCGLTLHEGKKVKKSETLEKITCKCGRIYIYHIIEKKYRRAKYEEV